MKDWSKTQINNYGQLIKNLARNLYSYGALVGTPSGTELFNIMKNPKPGDLVMETSTVWRHDPESNGIGWLKSIVWEDAYEPEEWDEEEEGRPIPKEKVFYIDTLGGKENFRWTNADFIKVPIGMVHDGKEQEDTVLWLQLGEAIK